MKFKEACIIAALFIEAMCKEIYSELCLFAKDKAAVAFIIAVAVGSWIWPMNPNVNSNKKSF
jgi:hypothetical protein